MGQQKEVSASIQRMTQPFFCRPKKNSKIFKLNAKKDAFYGVGRINLVRQFSWLLS